VVIISHTGPATISTTAVSSYETTRTISGSTIVATLVTTSTGITVFPSGTYTYTVPNGSIATGVAGSSSAGNAQGAAQNHKSNVGGIVGGVLAALIILVLLFVLGIYRRWLRRKRTTAASAQVSTTNSFLGLLADVCARSS
jgi:uncharacterized membrane protein